MAIQQSTPEERAQLDADLKAACELGLDIGGYWVRKWILLDGNRDDAPAAEAGHAVRSGPLRHRAGSDGEPLQETGSLLGEPLTARRPF
jgi:hypothetical protein